MKTLIAAILVTLSASVASAEASLWKVSDKLLVRVSDAGQVIGAEIGKARVDALASKTAGTATLTTASTASKVIPVVGWIAAIGLEGYLYTKEDGIAYWAVNSEDHLGDVSSVYNSAVDTTSSAAMSAYNYVSSIDYTFWN